MKNVLIPFCFLAMGFTMCFTSPSENKETVQKDLSKYSTAYFASGCFWCVEAIYEDLKGVEEAVSGYAGGASTNPTYESVGRGDGHAEVVEVYYDPAVVSFETLVEVYYGSQDPTTVGQKPDFGKAYRSIIFYKNAEEKKIIEAAKERVQGTVEKPVVTEILPFENFYKAEDYHQDFEKRNPRHRYIVGVSIPRLRRMQAKFPNLIRKH